MRCLRRYALVLAVLMVGLACEPRPSEERGGSGGVFEVGQEGVRLLYRDAEQGLREVQSVEDVPLGHRAVVIVVLGEEQEVSESGRVLVADLLGASRGDQAEGRWVSLEEFGGRRAGAYRGHDLAREVVFWAQEHAQLSPESERAEAASRARELLDSLEQVRDKEGFD